MCLLCSLRDYLFQCVVCSVYRVYHELIVRVRHYMGIFRLIEHFLDIVQILLGVHNRQRLENLLFFCLCFYFLLDLVYVIHFYNRRALDVKVFICYSGKMIRDQVGFYFREQCTFFSENVVVNLYPVTVVARAFEYIVATTFVVSIACGSVSHCVT